jgi:endonuclease/exonuclease/phosphatase family metal-dependent hydrolase
MSGLRVMTYNILAATEETEAGKGEERIKLICQVIEKAQPDLVAMQEVTDEALFQALARSLDFPHKVMAQGVVGYNLGLFSRYPVLGCIEHNNPEIFRHGILEAKLATPVGTLGCFVAHFHPGYASKDEDRRLVEVNYILERMQTYAPDPVLLMGDFNTMSPQDILRVEDWPKRWHKRLRKQGNQIRRDAIRQVLEAGYIDCYRFLHPVPPETRSLEGEKAEAEMPDLHSDETRNPSNIPNPGETSSYEPVAGYTLPAGKPNVRLDYMFASPGLVKSLQSCEVFRDDPAPQASDHLPLVSQFEVKN